MSSPRETFKPVKLTRSRLEILLAGNKDRLLSLSALEGDRKTSRVLRELVYETVRYQKWEQVKVRAVDAPHLVQTHHIDVLDGLCSTFKTSTGAIAYKPWGMEEGPMLKVKLLRKCQVMPGLKLEVGAVFYLPSTAIFKVPFRLSSEPLGDSSPAVLEIADPQ